MHNNVKKKDDKEIEVADGYKGVILPFELVQEQFLFEKNKEISIFNIDREHLPSLYIGFSSKIKEGEFPLYFNIEDSALMPECREKTFDLIDKIAEQDKKSGNRYVNIDWEYWNGNNWKKLDHSDFAWHL